MMMSRALLIFAVAFTAFEADAAEPCCVDELFAEAFLGGSTFSHDWPANSVVEPLNEPTLEMIGSQTRHLASYPMTSIAWRSDAELGPAAAAMDRALANQGWRALANPGVPTSMNGGFVLANTPSTMDFTVPQRFCKGREVVHVSRRETSHGTIVTLSATPMGSAADCDTLLSLAAAQVGQTNGMQAFMRVASALPRLRLPNGVDRLSHGDRNQGASSASHAVILPGTHVSAGEIMGGFDTQMYNLGWVSEAAFGAADLVGSVWRKTSNDGPLVAWLMAYDQGDDLLLRLTVLDPDAKGSMSTTGAISVLQAR